MPAGTQPSKHRQVVDVLRQRIHDGVLQPGSEMPRQSDVASEFGFSHMPVHNAYKTLVEAGDVVLREGRYIVVDIHTRDLLQDATAHSDGALRLDDLAEDARASGLDLTTRIDVMIPGAAVIPDRIRERLLLDDPPRAVLRRAIHTVNSKPAAIAELWLPRSLAVTSAYLMEPEPLPAGELAEFAELGAAITAFRDEVAARLPDRDEAELLQVAPSLPVLETLRTGYADDRPVLVHRTVSLNIGRTYDLTV